MVSYTQDGSRFSTVLYSEREGVLIHTGIQTLREKAVIERLDRRIGFFFNMAFLVGYEPNTIEFISKHLIN